MSSKAKPNEDPIVFVREPVVMNLIFWYADTDTKDLTISRQKSKSQIKMCWLIYVFFVFNDVKYVLKIVTVFL